MAKRKEKRGGKRGPEGNPKGHQRPTQFRDHKSFARSRRKLDPGTRARFVAQVDKFKEEWCDPKRTRDDLKSTWNLKSLRGEAQKFNVQQVTLTIPYRVAFMEIDGRDMCILLYLYKRSMGKNDKDYVVAAERAQQIIEGLR